MGAGLLAKGQAHPTLRQADPPLSRASPLPQGICGGQKRGGDLEILWERACSRRGRHIQH
ncbi:hypothetical protein C0J56_06225 [Pseudomonas fluorescens]|nr:hypothetical protein C0J56_06225 [Pseudomonas fluorescens]